jgi:PAS domain-containing protein
MEVSDTQAIFGILMSLAIFVLLIWQAAWRERGAETIEPGPVSFNFSRWATSVQVRLRPLLAGFLRSPVPRGEKVERVCADNGDGCAIRVLAITRDRGCRERLRDLAKFYSWDLFLCPNCERAAEVFASEMVPIVVCDRDTLNIDWREAFEQIIGTDRSRCVILCSMADDNSLWQEVIRRGGYDVVRKPVREEQLVRAIQFAWTFWLAIHPHSSARQSIFPQLPSQSHV